VVKEIYNKNDDKGGGRKVEAVRERGIEREVVGDFRF
jgi:hypothetical protein